jgi:transposase InsO family protein
MLRLEGWRVNVKRVHRLWKQEGYRVPRCRKKRIVSGQASHACNKKSSLFRNDVWTYDFIFDRLADGRALKILAVTDEYTRQSLALEAGISMNGSAVVSVLNKIAADEQSGMATGAIMGVFPSLPAGPLWKRFQNSLPVRPRKKDSRNQA